MTDSPAVRLARDLIRMDSAGSGEEHLARALAPSLEDAGFATELVELAPGRSSLLAHLNGGGALTLSGHLDTVPADAGTWAGDPFDAVTDGGLLVGRGSSDMKSGVAAMVVAATRHARAVTGAHGFTVVLTASEETGCQGASSVASRLPAGRVLVVGEATDNALCYGHKGASWLDLTATGVAAHGSRPELGRNAIDELLGAIQAARAAFAPVPHPRLGAPTLSLGTIAGGTQTNMVADRARASLDLRTVPGFDLDALETAIAAALPHGSVERALHLPPVWSPPESPTALALAGIVARVTGRPDGPAATSYFTDAAVLANHGTAAYILGPGDPSQPHSADESCRIDRIDEAVELYTAILDAWQRGEL